MEIAIALTLFAVTVVAGTLIAERLKVAAPLLLLLVGIIGSYLPFVHQPALSPELILVGVLPPLLYAAALNTSLFDFRKNLAPIARLSVGLVLFTAAGVGLVVWWLFDVPFAAAFALGAIVAPPDAVAATSVARRIGLPRRVVTILEGESLVNDATALVSLRTALAALAAPVTVLAVGLDFAKAVLIAVVVGVVVARVMGFVLARVSDPVVTTILSFAAPYVAYLPAEELHASGVLAVVVAGLLIGHFGEERQTAQARVTQRLNWATVQYALENSVFLLMGLQVHPIVATGLAESSPQSLAVSCLAVLATVIVLRFVWMFANRIWLLPKRRRRGQRRSVGWGESVVLSWAGMRGVVTIAAALTLPLDAPLRATFVLIALATVLGTLGLQGLTLPWVARRIGVRGPDPREDALQEATVLQYAMRDGLAAAKAAAGPEDGPVLQRLVDAYQQRLDAAWERLGRSSDEVEPPSDAYRRLRLTALAAERDAVLELRRDGDVDQEVISHVLATLDLEESMLVRVDERTDAIVSSPLAPALPDAPCAHLAEAPCALPAADTDLESGCLDCEREGTKPVHLRMCLDCGHVGCCDSSEGRHAERHFTETGHPVMRSIEPGESWRWCYADELLGSGAEDAGAPDAAAG